MMPSSIVRVVDQLAVSSSGTGTNLNLNIHGAQGVTYQVYYFSNWSFYGGSFLGTNGTIELNIPTANAPHRFIRFQLSR